MDKENFALQFAQRLKEALIQAGFSSARSTSGVDIHQLTRITGHSPQICRKYLSGQALPEPAKLVDIAVALNVAPGWLLFGDEGPREITPPFTIKKTLIHYVFEKAHALFNGQRTKQDVSSFLIGLAEEVSLMQATDEQSKQIIDLTLESVTHFKR